MNKARISNRPDSGAIAIIGMQGRFPGAADVEALWTNLKNGVEAVSTLTEEQMEGAGVPKDVYSLPNYVKAATILDDVDKFDAEFFGFSPRDAELTDPQHRLFLECAWHSLEDAGYVPGSYQGDIGVFGGCELSGYLYLINRNLDRLGFLDGMQLMITNDKDYMATQVAYKLNLTGPAITVQTSCSTSLVAICLACQSLIEGSCDIALAGGVTVKVPQRRGYLFTPGGILSPDGHCRPFDAAAQGTIVGSGVGLVVLKRLDAALRDGDRIRAVIRGFGHNNDGANKVSYAAPSAEGQARAIETAYDMAGVEPRSVGYIEAHGTATMLGDPIEVSALTRVFRRQTPDRQFCALGSIKGNVGHLSCAAGAAGLIKAALVVERGEIPPNAHFNVPAPGIDFASGPFYVNRDLTFWNGNGGPRRAGVSSFGVGGTNAHVILEEPPRQAGSGPGRKRQLLVMSARSEAALERLSQAYARRMLGATGTEFADIAYTARIGRARFAHRRFVVGDRDNPAGTALALLSRNPDRLRTFQSAGEDRPVVFMFSGQGAQYPGMGRDLYAQEPVFRDAFDTCRKAFRKETSLDLKPIVFPVKRRARQAAEQLKQTEITQPALFSVEYALAQLWMSWGVTPQAMIGHSIGEYVAATVAGMMSLPDAARLVARRGALMASCKPGTMLAIPKREADVRPLLPPDIAVAAVNAPGMTVVAGPTPSVERLVARLEKQRIVPTRLRTSHAFHSAMMDPILDPFIDAFEGITLNAPAIDVISNLTGEVLTAEAATDPAYWALHLRSAVRFADCVRTCLKTPETVLLEVGPGRSLCNLAGLQVGSAGENAVLASMDSRSGAVDEGDLLTECLGQLWAHGARIDWDRFHSGEVRRRVSLPGYPFERDSYWVDGAEDPSIPAAAARQTMAHWAYLPEWKAADLPDDLPALPKGARVLVLSDNGPAAAALEAGLREDGVQTVLVRTGKRFAARSDRSFTLNPSDPKHTARLIEAVAETNQPLTHVVCLWPLAARGPEDAALMMQRLAMALSRTNGLTKVRMLCVTRQSQPGRADGSKGAAVSPVLALTKVINQEFSNLRGTCVDMAASDLTKAEAARCAGILRDELRAPSFAASVAYIGGERHVLRFEPARLDPVETCPLLRDQGVYVITGGLGNIGLAVAEMLASRYRARLVLVGRSGFPAKEEWPDLAASKDEFDAPAKLARQLLEIDKTGQVMTVAADVADADALRVAVAQAEEELGPINGVFHLAGNVSEGFGPLKDLTETELHRQFRPKIGGAQALAEALAGKEPDFVMLGSSLSAVLGGLNLGYYAAANQFLDSFAAAQRETSKTRWMTVNWDQWAFAGQQHGENAISPAHGAEALERLMCLEADQVVISTTPLKKRLAEWVDFTVTPEATEKAAGHSRPNLSNPFEAPKSDMEKILAEIWEDLLGLSPVGIHDKFFELGGHSLLAIEMTMKIEEQLGHALEVGQIFDTPTIAGLAPLIEAEVQSGTAPKTQPAVPAPEQPEPELDLDGTKQSFQDMYDGVTRQLDGSAFGAFAHFLNYGYVPNGAPEASSVRLDDKMLNRNSVKLALEVIGAYPVAGKTLLDVGCGRGGTARTLVEFFDPAAVTGLDLSGAAIEFCRKTHTDARLCFVQGDAEELPFEDASFDAVTNIESSHTYPAIQRFYASVKRVLKPGGHFLYTDLMPVDKMHQCMELLRELGFDLHQDRDITPNVLLSCDEIAASRLGAFEGDQAGWSNFLAAPGSAVYESMKSGEWTYRILTLTVT
ncbi:MAG: SDR family NAD(P)-dependent oxidoreductase [Ruegeria sp.]